LTPGTFPLRGIDADNDPVFMNTLMEAWCDRPEDRIQLTRSRAYKSNDQAWVEQKNGVLVRRVVGYERLVGLEAARLLGELYAALRLFTNLFQPSFKLKSSVREGGRIKRQHHPPRTPLQRLLATGQVSKEKARALQELQQSSDPMALLETIRRHQAQLALLASGEQASNPGGTTKALADPDAENRSLESFLSGLQLLWKDSQPRPKRAKPRTGKRTRIDPFEADAERLRQWLAEEPIVTPKELMERLIEKNPERYGMRHLRTIQRRVSGYRLSDREGTPGDP
jgi:hypothetical protein